MIDAHAGLASTAASNGTRYSSRSVRSSISDEIVIRSNSVSLPTKCLMHAATRSRCTPADVGDGERAPSAPGPR